MVTEGVSSKRGIRRRGPVTKPSPKERTLKKFRFYILSKIWNCCLSKHSRKIVNEEGRSKGIRGQIGMEELLRITFPV
jgi:hypothetical protein